MNPIKRKISFTNTNIDNTNNIHNKRIKNFHNISNYDLNCYDDCYDNCYDDCYDEDFNESCSKLYAPNNNNRLDIVYYFEKYIELKTEYKTFVSEYKKNINKINKFLYIFHEIVNKFNILKLKYDNSTKKYNEKRLIKINLKLKIFIFSMQTKYKLKYKYLYNKYCTLSDYLKNIKNNEYINI